MNMAGVKVFKSKGETSLRPIRMFINEEKRFKRENILSRGILFGNSVDVTF